MSSGNMGNEVIGKTLTDHIVAGKAHCNSVSAVDDVGPNGAHNLYVVGALEKGEMVAFTEIPFQCGPIGEGLNGIHNEDLIAIVLDRLRAFQAADFKCRENAVAITKIEEGLMWLQKRTRDREIRGVEGTHAI